MTGKSRRSVPLSEQALPRVLNSHWPPDADRIADGGETVMVTARIVWRDGDVEYLHGQTTRWDGKHVYVRIDDARLDADGVWLRPDDVYRALP